MLTTVPRRAVLAAAVAAAVACTGRRGALALEPPAVQFLAGSMPRREEFASLSVALEELSVALEVRLSGATSCAEAREELRTPIFGSFLGYPGAPAQSPLLASIPQPRRAKATTEVTAMLQDLEAVDSACGGSSAVGLDSVRERLEGARNRLRELIALYYGEACIGSPCNGPNGLPVGS